MFTFVMAAPMAQYTLFEATFLGPISGLKKVLLKARNDETIGSTISRYIPDENVLKTISGSRDGIFSADKTEIDSTMPVEVIKDFGYLYIFAELCQAQISGTFILFERKI